MITRIVLRNFKCFLELERNLSALTVLTGLNSTGKSTLIQALRIVGLLNAHGEALLPGHGTWEELECKHSESGVISIHVYDEDDDYLSFSRNVTTAETENGESEDVEPICSLLENTHYISAARLGPKAYLPTHPGADDKTVGELGEHVFEFCTKNADRIVLESLRHHKASGNTFDAQLEAWMSEISPGLRFKFERNKQTDTSWLTVGSSLDATVARRPVNVGFGVSYTLPIIATLLAAPQGSLLLLENPEAHLHPKGQTRMGELMAFAAMSGLQVIVETHSDHLLDGIRIATKEGHISADDVSIHYFSKDAQDIAHAESPELREDGELSYWPDGFFDQSLINLSKLSKF